MLPPADEELKDVAPAVPEPEDAEDEGPAAVLGAPGTPEPEVEPEPEVGTTGGFS